MVFYKGHKVYMNGSYPTIFLNGQNFYVHRLEWEKHYGSIPKGYIVHHIDGNKKNWNIGNLTLLSRSEHIREHAAVVHKKGIRIMATKDDVTLIFSSIKEAAANCGTYPSGIQRIIKGKQYTANGWKFRRVGD